MIFTNSATDYFLQATELIVKDYTNPLLLYIFHKPKWFSFKEKHILSKYKKFLINKYSPSYDFLCSIYEFICTCENIYMWPNTTDSLLYAYRNLKPNIRSFKFIVREDDNPYTVEYTLYPNKQINLFINRSWGDLIKTDISFHDGEPMNLSIGDQILFDAIITETMNRLVKIFNQVYSATRSIELRDGNYEDCFSHKG